MGYAIYRAVVKSQREYASLSLFHGTRQENINATNSTNKLANRGYFLGTYQGQWMRGLRHGYGVRTSAPFGLASHYRGGGGARGHHRGSLASLTEAGGDPSERRTTRMDDARGGFVLTVRSDVATTRRGSLVEKTKKGLFSVSLNSASMCGVL